MASRTLLLHVFDHIISPVIVPLHIVTYCPSDVGRQKAGAAWPGLGHSNLASTNISRCTVEFHLPAQCTVVFHTVSSNQNAWLGYIFDRIKYVTAETCCSLLHFIYCRLLAALLEKYCALCNGKM